MKTDDLLRLLCGRRSCRDYRLACPVEDEKIGICLEAARLAPSACNKQPWRFVIVKDETLRLSICREGLLPGISMPWLENAPVIVVLCAELSFVTHKLAPLLSKLPYYMIDIGIAGEHFVLAAESLGLGTCWIGWLNEKPVRKILGIPGRIRIISLISLGYPAVTNEKASDRLGIDEISFRELWKPGK